MGYQFDQLDIKILILFLLGRISDGITAEDLAALTLGDGSVSYFDLTDCLAELRETGHIYEKDGLLHITDKGRRNGELTESSIPYSARIRAEAQAGEFVRRRLRGAMIQTESIQDENGSYSVRLSLSDGVGEILGIRLLAGDKGHARSLQKGFEQRAEAIYSSLIDALLSDES